jgi:malate synthase
MKRGPNVRRLIVTRMAALIVPAGSGEDSFSVAIEALRKKDNLLRICREATAWVGEALAAVKSAPDNPHGNNDEAIAAVILQKIEEAKAGGWK